MQKRWNRICVVLFAFMIVAFSFLSFAPLGVQGKAIAGENELVIHFIDVGQGDSIFIELPDGKNMIIDGGRVEYANDVVSYIKNLNITKIDYMVATHSDEDHIGGLIGVLNSFDVENIIRPFDVSKTKIEGAFVDELYSKFGGGINDACLVDNQNYAEFLYRAYTEKVGESLSNIMIASSKLNFASNDANNPYLISFYMPIAKDKFSTERIENGYAVEQYEDKNRTTAVVGLFTENHEYLFCGDATSETEREMLESLRDADKDKLKDVSLLKVAHHGAKGGTSADFLNLIKPTYAIVMVGKDNDYSHPAEETIKRLEDVRATIYRTDEKGNIVVRESGELLVFEFEEKPKSNFVFWALMIGFFAVVVGAIVATLIYRNHKKKGYGKIR